MKQGFVFEKMHGIGNDFVLIDNRDKQLKLSQEQIKALANRHTGIGFDQLLWLENSQLAGCDVAYRFFNPDGSEAEQCGNGQRCITRYLNRKYPDKTQFRVSGLAGIIDSKIDDSGLVTVNMGGFQSINKIMIQKQLCHHVVSGNPHFVIECSDIENCNLQALNQKYTQAYKEGINFEIVEILNRNQIKIRVDERGTGETLACGSGACAAVMALHSNGQLNNKVKVLLPGGALMVEYIESDNNIYLTGPAEHVFTGEMII
jgi:diaminopimelate epimerase